MIRVKLNRVLEVLENTVNHFDKEHGCNYFDDWVVKTKITDRGIEIDMLTRPTFCTSIVNFYNTWNNHRKNIIRAFKEHKRHNF